MKIGFDRYSMILDDQRVVIRSGAMHYFRLPHHRLWKDRLLKLKAGGYNTVDLYFNWDFHSPEQDVYDFTGIRDLKVLLDMVEEHGLYLIARPGPYINAETTRGGLPGWLLSKPDVILRNREEGNYQYSPTYMGYVREWYDQILPFVKDRNNMLMIQVENEYSTDEMEPDYIQELVQIVRGHGITVPTMHNDFYAAALYADEVDIYAIDNYSVTSFDQNWRTFPDVFSVIDHLETGIREECCQNRPLMVAELQAGWFAGWKGVPYQTIQDCLGREHIGIITRSFLGQGGTIFNHYKAVGGTNWDHIGATDAYTSYDFSAPISEVGINSKRLFEAKRINQLLQFFNLAQTNAILPSEIGLTEHPCLYKVRQDITHPRSHWIFTRNLSESTQMMPLLNGVEAAIGPFVTKILPYQVALQNGWELTISNMEPLAQSTKLLFIAAEPGGVIQLTPPSSINQIHVDIGLHAEALDNNALKLSVKELETTGCLKAQLDDYTVYFLGEAMADRLWALDNEMFSIGADMVLQNESYAAGHLLNCFSTIGQTETPMHLTKNACNWTPPELQNWERHYGEFPTGDAVGYLPISPAGSTMDANGLYEGSAWVQYQFTGQHKEISLHAQHIWGVYLNGHFIAHHEVFHVYPDVGSPEDSITIPLPAELQKTDGPNELLILVESLGHAKGFYDDGREPRGVLSIALDGEDISLGGKIKAAQLSPFAQVTSNTASPVIHASCSFTLNLPENMRVPLGLELDMDVNRADIWLNDILLGKYWRACRNQTLFYLPEGILNTNGINHLGLTLTNFNPQMTLDEPFPSQCAKLKLVPYSVFSKLSA